MDIHEIPRDYKGESRILSIFSMKALGYTAIGVVIGGIIWYILSLLGLGTLGIIILFILGIIGFCIGTFKIPDTKKFAFTEKTGGENIDDIILRWLKFKKKKNKIYVYMKEETKDE